ncbi:MAG: ABC transporter substrate-binding protein [Desulfobacteraceae bacterium]|nr:ABC transporter substrate-binding protein [Pseudomonadota bacterium]MCG2757315.1 ABC transporter substrate-binding protein [Desulfobacteraceae bacterium]
MIKTKVRISALLFLAIFLLAACGPQEVKKPPDKVSVQLKWVHQAQSAGFYLAQEKGYYAEENIAATFLEGGPGIDNIEKVVTGGADFGVEAPMGILLRRSQGKPVVAIAAIYQRNPTVFVSLADSGITRPPDFLGRTVAVSDVEGRVLLKTMMKRYGKIYFKAMMEKLDLDIHQVTIVPYQYDFSAFYSGEADVTEAYANGGLIRIRQKGYNVNLIWPGDYGVHVYGDTLITTDEMIAENPDLVTRFLRATLRGWREAIEDPEAAVAITMKYAREKDSELQTRMMDASVPLIHTGEDQIGWMRAGVWERTHQLLLEEELLTGPVDPDKAYTMEFLQRIYGGKK